MQNKLFVLVLLVLSTVSSAALVEISYDVENIAANTWQYNYYIANLDSADSVGLLTIWFDEAIYADLVIAESSQIANDWDNIIQYSIPDAVEAGKLYFGYDLQAVAGGILPAQSVSGFAMQFTWNGQGSPDDQAFTVLNDSYEAIFNGTTLYVPEPASMILFAVGGLLLRKKVK